MSNSARPGVDPYAFDPAFYAQAYPDVLAQDPNTDLLGHYLRHGQAEGRARNALEASGALNFQEGNAVPAVDRNPRLDPNDPASWAAYRDRAHASTEGLNRMPRVAPDTASLSRDPLQVQRQFYPNGASNTAQAASREGAMGGVGAMGAMGGKGAMSLASQTVTGPGGQMPMPMGNALSGGYNPQPVQNLGMKTGPAWMYRG